MTVPPFEADLRQGHVLRPQAASRYHGPRRRHRLGAGGEEVRHRAERHGGMLGARRPCHDGHSRLLPGPGARQGNNDLTVMLKEADGCCFNDMILASEHNAEFQTLRRSVPCFPSQ